MSGINFRPPAERPPTDFYEFFKDFTDDGYDATNWVITVDSGGSQAVDDVAGGVLVITNDDDDDDKTFYQWDGEDNATVAEIFKLAPDKMFYFGVRMKVNEAIQCDFIAGLQVTDTSPLAVSDGVWFQKDDGDAELDVHVAAASAQTDKAGVYTVANDTWMVLELLYGGDGQAIGIYVDGVKVGGIAVANLPSTELTMSFGIQQGEGTNAKVMSVDWVRAVVER